MIKTLIIDKAELILVKQLFRDELNRLSGRPDGWAIDEDNKPAMEEVCQWIAGGDLRQGPRLNGPVGTGKSSLIEAASATLRAIHGVGIRSIDAVELASAVAKEGREAIKRFADHTVYPFLVLEDLMLEKNAPSYVKGDDGINSVADLVQLRYKGWQRGLPLCTGFTDNATDKDLLDKYGPRCVSRQTHMAFLVKVGGSDRRREAPLPKPAQMSIAHHQPAPLNEEDVEAGRALAERLRATGRTNKGTKVFSLRELFGTTGPVVYTQLDPAAHLSTYTSLLKSMTEEELVNEHVKIESAAAEGHEHFLWAITNEQQSRVGSEVKSLA